MCVCVCECVCVCASNATLLVDHLSVLIQLESYCEAISDRKKAHDGFELRINLTIQILQL